jgi:hypothetical protein
MCLARHIRQHWRDPLTQRAAEAAAMTWATHRRVLASGLTLIAFCGASRMVRGQTSTPEPCRVLNGIRIAANWGDSGTTRAAQRSADSSRSSLHLDTRTMLDTVLIFNVADRTWRRPHLDAEIAAGVSGTLRRSTTSASTDTSAGRWHTCVGIILGAEQPTLTVHGARGQVHLKVDLTPLRRISADSGRDSTRRDRNRR